MIKNVLINLWMKKNTKQKRRNQVASFLYNVGLINYFYSGIAIYLDSKYELELF